MTPSIHGSNRAPTPDFGSDGTQPHAILCGRLVVRVNEDCGLFTSIHCDVQHVCRNDNVIAGLHDVAILKFVTSPQLDGITADHVKSSLVMFVHMRSGSPSWR